MTIFIGNLSFDAEQDDIIGVFSSYGEVKDCKIPLDRETGRKRGFAFVDMVDDVQEQKAIAHILGTLDEKIERNNRTNETLEGIAKALFKIY